MIKKKKGKSIWPNGRVFSDKHKKNMSKALKGRKFSEERRKKMMGRIPWNKGKHHTEKSKEKMRLATALARQRGCYNMKPNKPEKIMMGIIKENNLPFNYVGDGQVIIGGFNPDFLSKNPKHIIEVFGDYWHNLPNVKEKDKRKLKTYFRYGYKTLIIWEHELKNCSQVLNKIKEFIAI